VRSADVMRGKLRGQYILVIEYDLSLTTGYSINERESAVALLDQFPKQVRVVCPEPAFPDSFFDPRIDYVSNHRRHHPLRYPWFLVVLYWRLRQMIRERTPDAVVFRPGPFPVIPALMLHQGTAVLLKKPEGYALFARPNRSWLRQVVAKGALPLYERIMKGCIGVDVESHAYAEWLPSRFPVAPDKLRIIPNGANTRRFTPQDRMRSRTKYGWDHFRHIVGYVGAIDDLRCVDLAVDAAARLRDIPDLAFVFVGGGARAEEIRQRVLSEGLEGRVILPGFLPYDEVPTVMGSFDLAIDLSRVALPVGSTEVIGSFSQKIAQYLACGIPVIAWETLDTAFLDREGIGRTVPVGDVDELANVIRALVAEGPRLKERRQKARAFVSRTLSAEAIAHRRMEFWEEAIDRRSHTRRA
jgi:glycosyltransferase involved in cell wall biosynthesis